MFQKIPSCWIVQCQKMSFFSSKYELIQWYLPFCGKGKKYKFHELFSGICCRLQLGLSSLNTSISDSMKNVIGPSKFSCFLLLNIWYSRICQNSWTIYLVTLYLTSGQESLHGSPFFFQLWPWWGWRQTLQSGRSGRAKPGKLLKNKHNTYKGFESPKSWKPSSK
jgi:hypothetical protein